MKCWAGIGTILRTLALGPWYRAGTEVCERRPFLIAIGKRGRPFVEMCKIQLQCFVAKLRPRGIRPKNDLPFLSFPRFVVAFSAVVFTQGVPPKSGSPATMGGAIPSVRF